MQKQYSEPDGYKSDYESGSDEVSDPSDDEDDDDDGVYRLRSSKTKRPWKGGDDRDDADGGSAGASGASGKKKNTIASASSECANGCAQKNPSVSVNLSLYV